MKLNNLLLISAAFPLLLLFTFNSSQESSSWSPPPPVAFEDTPPVPVQYWVQKLRTPLRTGENMIFRVKYESDDALPSSIDVYNSSGVILTLKDDGVFPDLAASDNIYSTYKQEDLVALKNEMYRRTNKVTTANGVFHFTGHSGEKIPLQKILALDWMSFDAGNELEVSKYYLDIDDCEDSMDPTRSLFITDLSVVEDKTRTYRMATTTTTAYGNPVGAWTFGTLMKNIENNQHPNGFRGFMKDFVKSWAVNQTVGTETVSARLFVMETFIAPWIKKARPATSLPITLANWEQKWDSIPQDSLRKYAPFKLMAIVNRIDLRGNHAYSTAVTNAGETRFIFTLINPVTGEIPVNPDQTASASVTGPGFIDWRGMNVILEYGNTQTTRCALKTFAQSWADLSLLTIGSQSTNSTFKQTLEGLTNLVTAANSAPSKPNGSAINRIRTNEKLFIHTNTAPGVTSEESWELADWEFRQFELDATTHKLKLVPLTNNPSHKSNYATNIEEDYSTAGYSVTNEQIIDWIYAGNRIKVKNGNFNMPSSLLTASGIVRREEAQYFDLKNTYWKTKYPSSPTTAQYNEAQMIRHQLSLNTCVGCHNGETKTRFVQINSMKYGEYANYRTTNPNGLISIQDNALYPWGGNDPLQLGGHNAGNAGGNFHVSTEIIGQNFFQNLSAMLTGLRLRKYTNSTQNYDDDDAGDNINVNNDGDKLLEGLFYVIDPSSGTIQPDGNGGYETFPETIDKYWGFNDIFNRKRGLCEFINSNCNLTAGGSVFAVMNQLKFVPFSKGSH